MRLVLVSTVLAATSTSWWQGQGFSHAFSTHAGDCYQGPAVSGRHLASDSGYRSVTTGSLAERPSAIQFYVDGTVLSSSTNGNGNKKNAKPLELSAGVEHVLELVASEPFKGALIRVESSSSSSMDFVLTPLINAQVAMACENEQDESSNSNGAFATIVQGVSHYDGSLKNALSASIYFTLDAASNGNDSDEAVTVDVTVVDYNNATGSVYWYSRYNLVVANVATTPSPTTVFPTISPSTLGPTFLPTTPQPTQTAFPTYGEPCWVCGVNGGTVSLPNQVIVVLDESATCSELQEDGASGLIPTSMCAIVQEAARNDCGCVDELAATSEASESTARSKQQRAVPTVVPTSPPYTQCLVCGVHGAVTNVETVVLVNGRSGTCLDWQDTGRAGLLSYDQCHAAVPAVEAHCGCEPLSLSVPTPSPTSSGQFDLQQQPTVTPYPTVTAYPTFAERCLVCGDESMQVSAYDQVVSVQGDVGTCLDLEQQGALGFVNPALCQDAQLVAAQQCACIPTSIGRTGEAASKAAPMGVKTFTPTVTPFPTVSFSPTFSEHCLVCGHGKRPSLLDTVVVVDNLALTCRELATAGREREISPSLCSVAQSVAQLSCGCR